MMAPTAWRPSGRNPSLQSNPSACIAFTISNATGKLSIVAARCDMGVLLLWAWQPQLEYPFLPLTQNLLRHHSTVRIEARLLLMLRCASANSVAPNETGTGDPAKFVGFEAPSERSRNQQLQAPQPIQKATGFGPRRASHHVREEAMKASLAMSLGLAFLLATAGIALAADPGTEDPNNWPQYNRTANAWRYSPLDQINKDNVAKLSVAWIAHGGDITMGIQETPIVIDGVIYSISSGDRVAALDGKTGQQIWSYEPRLDPLTKKVLFAPYSRGVAVGHGMVFIGTVDGRGIALDQKTGKEKWQVQLTDFANCHGCNFTSPPVVAGDMLTFGSTAGELATQGKIFGVEAATGKKVWEFNTIKEDPKSWPGESGRYGGGGAWMPGTYDAETDTVFYGTGNPGKDFVDTDREGDNLYTDSIVALDAKTGKLKWYRQEIPQDVWDYDSPYEVLLFKKDGKDLIVHMNKSGYAFVLDKGNGNIENIWPISDVKNFVKDIDPKTGKLIGRVELPMNKETLICPSTFGGRS